MVRLHMCQGLNFAFKMQFLGMKYEYVIFILSEHSGGITQFARTTFFPPRIPFNNKKKTITMFSSKLMKPLSATNFQRYLRVIIDSVKSGLALFHSNICVHYACSYIPSPNTTSARRMFPLKTTGFILTLNCSPKSSIHRFIQKSV